MSVHASMPTVSTSVRRIFVGAISAMALVLGFSAAPASAETTGATVICPVGSDLLQAAVLVPAGLPLEGETTLGGCDVVFFKF